MREEERGEERNLNKKSEIEIRREGLKGEMRQKIMEDEKILRKKREK